VSRVSGRICFWRRTDITAVGGLSLSTVGLHLLWRRTLIPVQRRVNETEVLRAALLSKEIEAERTGNVTISEREYKHIARIERALVARERADALAQLSNTRAAVYWVVQQSATAIAATSSLPPETRLKVQSRIEDLSTSPEPADVRRESADVWSVVVPETDREIRYSVGSNPRRIIIHDVVRSADRDGQHERIRD